MSLKTITAMGYPFDHSCNKSFQSKQRGLKSSHCPWYNVIDRSSQSHASIPDMAFIGSASGWELIAFPLTKEEETLDLKAAMLFICMGFSLSLLE